MSRKRQYNKIPTALQEIEFNEFVLPHLKKGKRGPSKKLPFLKLFNYILYLMHTGCQWENIPIDKDTNGKPGERSLNHTRQDKKLSGWISKE